jgi:broad specificity phosphatase PhoE
MPVLLLIRHAQASFGTADYDQLSEPGLRQVMALDDELRRLGVHPARVAIGSARRHEQTAMVSCAASVARHADSGFDEYPIDEVLAHHGATDVRLEGPGVGSTREFQAHLDRALTSWIEAEDASPCSMTWPRFSEQASAALGAVAAELHRGETALVFTSAGPIAAICAALLGSAAPTFLQLNRVQVNAAITKIVHGARGSSLISFNEHGYLQQHGESLVTYR